MGRTNKFSFPIPGRKHKEVAPLTVQSRPGNNLSKAQRILGTTSNLNIDVSPTREEPYQQWKKPGSRSSGMSISISDSTHSAESIPEAESERWDYESNVLPKGRYADDGTTSTLGGSGRLRNEGSSSTLRSFYDRQKTPLSISQQTSASSARDQALRKGSSPVVQRSPLLQVETALDPFDAIYAESRERSGFQASQSPEKKKKPGRLDLTKLFPRSRRLGDKSESDYLTPSPSSVSTNGSQNGVASFSESARRKLKKSLSKESIKSQKLSIRSDRSHEQRQTNGTLLQLYDHYENMPARSPRMDQIPESRVADGIHTVRNGKHVSMHPVLDSVKPSPELSATSSGKEPFSWKNVRSSLAAANVAPSGLTPSSLTPPNSNIWESTSAASISSRNTRASKTTAGSSFTHSDLQEKSVLSLSDDSEDDSEMDPGMSPGPPRTNGMESSIASPLPKEFKTRSEGLAARNHGQRMQQQAPYLTVPKSNTASSRLSGPSSPPTHLTTPPSSHHRHSQITPKKDKKDKKNRPASVASGTSSYHIKPPSIASIQSIQAPYTPPLSPSSMVFRQTSERSSRFMAVTQQEEALLEALRQKRARMREEIIEEHETTMKTPPRVPASEPTRLSSVTTKSSASTLRSSRADKTQTVLLYLDTPLASAHAIDAAEPSPDLEDFLGFESDDSTPRTSWVPSHKGKPRPDSFIAPLQGQDTESSHLPPSAARLSAVGAARGFKPARSSVASSKKRHTGVRFAEDSPVANSDEFLVDEEPMLFNV
ncbi:hypothetical protein VTL71DRAFT_738 [Oculimacula yallundae]|uniref:Proteophosphoglycan ppg4 n=1 Tax=Oculimacula yallundae TaxID=86028 RepID=A0ABR4D107_9HELO